MVLVDLLADGIVISSIIFSRSQEEVGRDTFPRGLTMVPKIEMQMVVVQGQQLSLLPLEYHCSSSKKNVVGRLLDDISEWVTDSKHLEEIVNSFYKNLFYGEGAIFNIGSFKERGQDGFQALFYQSQ